MKAFMTRADFLASGSVIIFGMADGTTCHDRPNLSFSQPQGPSRPPAVRAFQ
jgi:hypothetical protein